MQSGSPLRVCHVATTISRGGAENHLMDLIRGQVGRGWRMDVVYLKGDGYWREPLESLGVSVHPLHVSRYLDPQAVLACRRLVRHLRPDVVHVHLPPAELYGRVAVVGSTSAFVVSKHNQEHFWPAFPVAGRQLGRWVSRRACTVICITEAVRAMVATERQLGPDADVRVIGYGIDPRPYMQDDRRSRFKIRSEWGVLDSDLIIGCLARLVRQKGVDTLVRSVAHLARREEMMDFRVVVVGSGPLERDLRRLAKAEGVEEQIVWAGWREDTVDVMQALDLLVLPSRWEGLGRVLIEAAAAGKPVVATRVGGIPETVGEEMASRLVEPDDPSALAEAIVRALEPEERKHVSRLMRDRTSTFSLEAVDAAVAEVYVNCLHRSRFD